MRILFFIIPLIILLTGCFFDKTDSKGNTNANLNEGQVNITGNNGEELSVNNGKLPDNFPKDIPVYPSSQLLYAMTYTEKNVITISLNTEDSIKSIEEYYKKELSKNSWKIEQVFNTDKSSMFTGSKQDRVVSIAITIDTGEKNNIAISVSKI